MSELIDKYIRYISTEKRYSQRTCEIYKDILERFEVYSVPDDEKFIERLNVTSVRNYIVHLSDELHLGARTLNQHLSVLSGFCRYLMGNGLIDGNPVRLAPRPKTEKRLPSIIRKEAIDEYLAITEYDEQDMADKLNHDLTEKEATSRLCRKVLGRLIVSILYNTGIRRSELCALNRSSIDFSRKMLKVLGKGGKMREIPVISELCEEISLYLQSVDTMGGSVRTDESPLLLTPTGKRLYPMYVERVIREELGRVESITGRKSPHVLRHTLATELLDDGADLNSIKELLGHSSLAATQIYTHNSIEKLKTVYNNAHPRAKNGGNYGDKD